GGVGGTAGTGAVSGTGGVGGTSGTGGVGGTGGLPPLGGHAGAAGEAGYAGTAGSGAYAGYAGTAGSGAYAGYAGTAGSGAYAGSGGTVNDGGVTDGSVGGTGGTVIDAGVCEVSNGYEASALIGIQGTGIEVGGYRFRYVGEDTQTNEIIVKITCGDEVIVTDMRIPFGNQVTIVDGTNQKQITVGELAHSSTAARISIRVSDADLDGGISDGGVEDGGSDAGLEPRCVGVHRDSTEYSMLIRLGTTIDVGGYLVTPKQLTPDNIVLTDVLCASDNVVVTSDTECTISPHPNIISVPEDGKEINVIIHAASEYAARVTIQVKNL
ncbi:hypothetical protein JXA56_01770, partial [Candidatus Micrarchaeota archaeon]|nr:hypothetical protein [Candidatus Micrarchaeota archaeon]